MGRMALNHRCFYSVGVSGGDSAVIFHSISKKSRGLRGDGMVSLSRAHQEPTARMIDDSIYIIVSLIIDLMICLIIN